MLDVGEPAAGETVVVSAAAGAVGTVASQLAKREGCRVVGIAGSDRKVSYLEGTLGLDAGVNYRTTTDWDETLATVCPDGVDVYFDNVGGEISDAVMEHVNDHARIVLCGQVALYNDEGTPVGPRYGWTLIKRRARMEGFLVTDYADRYDEARRNLAAWYRAGDLTTERTIVEGFENAPDAFLGLFEGTNVGKLVVEVSPPSTER